MATYPKGASGIQVILEAVDQINRAILDANRPSFQSDPVGNVQSYYIATTLLRLQSRSNLLHSVKTPRESKHAAIYFEQAYEEFIRLGYGPK